MAITFPNNPSVDQVWTAENGIDYIYDGEKWTSLPDAEGQIPAGGTTGQFLAKINDVDYNMEWTDAAPPTSIGTTPPTGDLEDGQLWWRSDTGVLYIYYTDGDSSQWVQAAIGSDTRVQAEVYTGDVPPLSAGEGDLWWNTTDTNLYVYYQSVWVQSNPVPPEQENYWQRNDIDNAISPANSGDDVRAYTINGGHAGPNNVIINGGMSVNQRGVAVTENNDFPVDRWRVVKINHGAYSGIQDGDHPPGFGNSIQIACTTSKPSLDANSMFVLMQRIEGLNVQQFDKGAAGAKPFSVSFWFKTNKAGNYTARLEDVVNDRSVSYSFEVTAENASNYVWVQYTHTFPADTTGSWPSSNTSAVEFQVWLCAGSDFTSGPLSTTWGPDDIDKVAAGQVNFFDSTNNRAFLTGVQLTASGTPIAFEHEDYGTTLRKCQRYTYVIEQPSANYYLPITGFVKTTSEAVCCINYPVTLRDSSPTLSFRGDETNFKIFHRATNSSVTGISASDRTENGGLYNFATSGLTVGDAVVVGTGGAAGGNNIIINAEL